MLKRRHMYANYVILFKVSQFLVFVYILNAYRVTYRDFRRF